MPDYQKGKIYMLATQKNCKIYIGSTTTTLHSRFQSHQSKYKRWLEGIGKNYKSAFELLEYNDCKIELIEECPCDTLKELHLREGYHMLLNKDFIVNKCIAGRTRKECNGVYYNKNKDKITETRRLNTYLCVECNKELSGWHKDRHEATAKHIGENYNKLHPI